MSQEKTTIPYTPNVSDSGHLIWVNENFISKDLYTPFMIKNDNEYYGDLKRKYNILLSQATKARADEESIRIITDYKNKILEVIRLYYKGRISSAQNKIKHLVKECLKDPLAVNFVEKSWAFPGVLSITPQFFHARIGTPRGYKAKEMLHIPYSMRSKTGNYRFSLPGVPSYYLANSSYCCWLEMGMPPEHEFNVSPVLLDGSQKILNLAVNIRDVHHLNEFEPWRTHTWIKLLMLMMASSYRVEEINRTFKSEYVIPQCIMLACKELGLDGIAYYSCQVEDHIFAQSAINLALFASEERIGSKYSDICNHIKVGDAFNYFIFQQLGPNQWDTKYELRWMKTGLINNIGSYDNQYEYAVTDFCKFDMFLFNGWKSDNVEFGNAVRG